MTFQHIGEAANRVVDNITPRQAHIERISIVDREQWLALRRNDVTGSVAGALLGVHEYETEYGLWMSKTGKVPEDNEQTSAMERGQLLEPVAIELLRRRKPHWNIEYPVGHYYRDPAARLGCTPDAFATVGVDLGIVQIKSVEQSVFRRKWRAESGEIECPLWIAVQAMVEAELTGAKWACVVALVVGYGLDLHVVEVPLIPSVMARLKEKVAEFWRSVETDIPPEPNYAKDHALIAGLYGTDTGATIDLSGENQLPELAAEDRRLAGEIKEKAERRKAIKGELLFKMGEAAIATMNGKIFATARTVHRSPYQVSASSFRDVRFKPNRESTP